MVYTEAHKRAMLKYQQSETYKNYRKGYLSLHKAEDALRKRIKYHHAKYLQEVLEFFDIDPYIFC